MEVLNVQIQKDRERMLFLCSNLLKKHLLVPILGSGFSCGTPTDNGGFIPSGLELRNKLLHYISNFSGYTKHDLEDISSKTLQDLSADFWNIFNRIPKEDLEKFYLYVSQNFTGISYFKDFQKAFLTISWPSIFTLNYDSLIENFSKNYFAVIPFDKINPYYAKDKTKLFKLHGDAQRFLSTGDSKYFVLSRNQYVQCMMDSANHDMLEELLTAFASKSILFLGCGLSEELDLLYSSQINLAEKLKDINSTYQSIIYVSYEKEDDISASLSQRVQDKLTQYGISTVFRFSSEMELQQFFLDLSSKTGIIPHTDTDNFLSRYSSIQFQTLPPTDIKCREFLFNENSVWKSFANHKIILPGYNIERSLLKSAINYISQNNPLCFISGNFFCGKTYFLLQIAHYFSTRQVFIFCSGTTLNDTHLDALIEKKDALICFDTKTLTTNQAKYITTPNKLDMLCSNNSAIVIAIDKSDAPMFRYIFETKNTDKEFKMFPLGSKFNDEESRYFNEKIGSISFPPYIEKDTILDYVVNNEQKLLGTISYTIPFLEPQKELLSHNPQRRIMALIMLATEIRIPVKRAIQFKIDTAINDIINCCNKYGSASVIEKDYSYFNEDSSGFVYVCNSKYWVIRALSVFAKNRTDSTEIISNSYLKIIEVYRSIYKENDVIFYQKCEPYYFFDHIQLLFNHRWFLNSSKLVNAIYDRLLPLLANSYQFLHQKAKGKLIIAQTQLKNKKFAPASATLKEAQYNIIRAIELAKQAPHAKNIEESLLHMTYTEGRIFIELTRIDIGYIPQAVNACYDVYQLQQTSQHHVYDFATAGGNDRFSFNKFKKNLTSNPHVKSLPDLDSEKVSLLLTRWSGKRIRFSLKHKRTINSY